MKKFKIANYIFLMSFCLALLMGACSNEGTFPDYTPSSPSWGEPDVVLNVSEPVEDFDTLLSDMRSAKVIRLVTPGFTRTIGSGGVSDMFESSEAHLLALSNDSISIALADDYIAITSKVLTENSEKNPGTQYYLIHKSKEYIAGYQAELKQQIMRLAQTRAGGELPEVDTHSEQALSISKTISSTERECCEVPMPAGVSSSECNTPEVALSRNANLRIGPREKNVVRIWLLRLADYTNYGHEIVWQQMETEAMIRDILSGVKVEFYTRGTDFQRSQYAAHTLHNFIEYVRSHKNSGYDWSSGVGQDIFVVISKEAFYGYVTGLAHENTYNIRRESNPLAFALCGMDIVTCPLLLAHEVGHVIGAKHTDYSWWQNWGVGCRSEFFDVMSYKTNRTPYIREPNNRMTVRENLRYFGR